MKPSRIAAALALCALASAARAQAPSPGDTRADVRCLLAFGALLQNPAYKDAAGTGMFYFAGRLDGRDPNLDLAAAMKREIGNMATADYRTEAQRCGQALKARNEALKATGEAVKAGR
jgi:hypothetical protein